MTSKRWLINKVEAVAGFEDVLTDGGENPYDESIETQLCMTDGAGDNDHDFLLIGDHVHDVTDDDEEKTMVVVETTPHNADEYHHESSKVAGS